MIIAADWKQSAALFMAGWNEDKQYKHRLYPKGGSIVEQCVYTKAQIEAMENVDVRAVDPDSLRDIRDVVVNPDLPKKERILDFIRQIGNPYCYRHGQFVIKVTFADTDVTLEDRMLAYIRSKC